MTTVVAATAETFTAGLAERLVAFRQRECVLCYTNRMVDEHGCPGRLRFATRWLQHHRHSRPDVVRDLRDGGVRCDCWLLLVHWTLREDLLAWSPLMGALDWPEVTPACTGAPSGDACAIWRRQPAG